MSKSIAIESRNGRYVGTKPVSCKNPKFLKPKNDPSGSDQIGSMFPSGFERNAYLYSNRYLPKKISPFLFQGRNIFSQDNRPHLEEKNSMAQVPPKTIPRYLLPKMNFIKRSSCGIELPEYIPRVKEQNYPPITENCQICKHSKQTFKDTLCTNKENLLQINEAQSENEGIPDGESLYNWRKRMGNDRGDQNIDSSKQLRINSAKEIGNNGSQWCSPHSNDYIDNFLRQSLNSLKDEIENNNSKQLDNGKFTFCSELRSDYNNDSLFQEAEDDDTDLCDIQPMPVLKRPLIHGYGTNWPISEEGFTSVKANHCEQFGLPEESTYPVDRSNFPETYWDFWLHNRLEAIENSKHPRHRPKDKHCSYAQRVKYDPEFLLAQTAHPESLNNATFLEYSSQIRSSIMDRLLYNSRNEQYGSSMDISQHEDSELTTIFVDTGYFSESDVMKIQSLSSHNDSPISNNKHKGNTGSSSYVRLPLSDHPTNDISAKLENRFKTEYQNITEDRKYPYTYYYTKEKNKNWCKGKLTRDTILDDTPLPAPASEFPHQPDNHRCGRNRPANKVNCKDIKATNAPHFALDKKESHDGKLSLKSFLPSLLRKRRT